MASASSGAWVNPDGLKVPFGNYYKTPANFVNRPRELKANGLIKQIVIDYDLAKLGASGVSYTTDIDNDGVVDGFTTGDVYLPANASVLRVTSVTGVAAAGGTSITLGTFTLAGAASGFQTFSSAIGNGNTTYYAIVGGSEWEVGLGTVAAGTLARTTVIASSTGSAVSFSAGTKNVFCTYPADRAVAQDSTLTAYAPQIAASNGLVMNNMTITANTTIPTGYSANSVGAVTINSGVTVTVPSGSRWVVL